MTVSYGGDNYLPFTSAVGISKPGVPQAIPECILRVYRYVDFTGDHHRPGDGSCIEKQACCETEKVSYRMAGMQHMYESLNPHLLIAKGQASFYIHAHNQFPLQQEKWHHPLLSLRPSRRPPLHSVSGKRADQMAIHEKNGVH